MEELFVLLFAATWPFWLLGPAVAVIEFADRRGRFTIRQLFAAMTVVALLLGVVTYAVN